MPQFKQEWLEANGQSVDHAEVRSIVQGMLLNANFPIRVRDSIQSGTREIRGNVVTEETFTAGETIDDHDFYFIEDSGAETISQLEQSSQNGFAALGTASDERKAETFSFTHKTKITGITGITVRKNTPTPPSDGLKFGIQKVDSNGDPDGTFLGSFTETTIATSPSSTGITDVLDSAVTCDAGVTYALVVERTDEGQIGSDSGYGIQRDNTGPYSGGTLKNYDDGSWSDVVGSDMKFSLTQLTEEGKAYRTNAASANMIGGPTKVCKRRVDIGEVGTGLIGGVLDGFNGSDQYASGLSFGDQYLQDQSFTNNLRVAGRVGTSAGTNSKKVGFSDEADSMIIIHNL